MNKENIRFNLYFVSRFLSQHVINTTLQAIQEEQRDQRRKSRSVRCHQEILPSSSLLFYIRSLAHATAVVVIVMADATVTRSLPPHHHQHLLRPRHSLTCWSGPVPFPRPAGVPTDGTLGPRCLSKGSSRLPVRHP
jgi:hypothetical protein